MEHSDSDTHDSEGSHMEIAIKTEVKSPATSPGHIDIEVDVIALKLEPGLLPSLNSEPVLLVKEEILKDGSQGTTTPAGTGTVNQDCGTSLKDMLSVKREPDEIDIEPTVLQYMDIHYNTNKNISDVIGQNTIGDDSNEAVPFNEIKKESLEDKSRASCKYSGQNMTEDDYDKAHLNLRQQMKLQRHCLSQQHTTWSTGFKCDETLHKPQLLSVHNKVNHRNSRNSSMMTSSVVVATHSNQKIDQITKTKQKYDVCGKEYSSKTESGAQSPGCQRNYQCIKCDARFKRPSCLKTHMRVHTGEKPYQCVTCDARFKQRGYLTVHMREHTGEKPNRCDMCDARFSRKGQLICHMRVHTVEKPYRCDTCDTRFKRRGDLTVHMRVHTGEKPYRCDTCDARFKQRGYLTIHTRLHSGEKPYQCDMCYARFLRKGQIIVHMRVHTGEKP